MLVFRSLAIGLCAGCFALLVHSPTIELRVIESPPAALAPAPPHPAPTIVDAAPGITSEQLALALRLEPGEQIVSVDDVFVGSTIGAGVALARRERHPGQYIDVGVTGPAGERRILVLLH